MGNDEKIIELVEENNRLLKENNELLKSIFKYIQSPERIVEQVGANVIGDKIYDNLFNNPDNINSIFNNENR